MKSFLIASLLMTPPPVIGVVDDLTNPIPRPPKESQLNRVPWTMHGAQFMIEAAREMCQPADSPTYCQNVERGKADRGFSVHEKATGKFLFYFDRAIAEEVTQDYARTRAEAEVHHPYSNHIAKLEAQKSQWEYVAIACNTAMGPYCGAMAAKLQKFKEVVTAACAGGLGVCQKYVKDKQTEIQKEIDKVLAICGKSDQACFDYITGGKESQAKAEFDAEKASGGRPPHTPSRAGYRPMFLPGGDASVMWDDSCDKCKVYDGEEAEDF